MHSNLALFLNRDAAAVLLEHEKWKEMLRNSDRESTTPMRGLIVFMPGKLNHCIMHSVLGGLGALNFATFKGSVVTHGPPSSPMP